MRFSKIIALVALVSLAECRYDSVFTSAFSKTFALSSGADNVEHNVEALSRIEMLMTRHSIPLNITQLRWNTTDAELMNMAILAAVAHISPWQRLPKNQKMILVEDNGRLLPAYSISSMESNIMLCVICTMLAVIASIHVLSMRPVNGSTV